MVNDAKGMGEAQSRAYIGISKVDSSPKAGMHYFTILNFGNTPAHKVNVGYYLFEHETVDLKK